VLNEYWPREREEWAICKEDQDAPLVDMPTWLKVQDRLDQQSRVGQNRQEPAANALICCKVCNLRRSEKKLARMLAALPIDPGLCRKRRCRDDRTCRRCHTTSASLA
jgi:hypothetical protein